MKKASRRLKTIYQRFVYSGPVVALVSFFWLVLRTGISPRRISYPCQQAATVNLSIFGIPLLSGFLARMRRRRGLNLFRLTLGTASFAVLLLAGWFGYRAYQKNQHQKRASSLFLQGWDARAASTSEIFAVKNVPVPSGGNHSGVDALIDLMTQEGKDFYQLIRPDDVVVIKINSQWPECGGTNTDVLKGLVHRIVNHPEGFTGEVVIADNTHHRPKDPEEWNRLQNDLDWRWANAEDQHQSPWDVAQIFKPDHRVSTWAWRRISGLANDQDIGIYVSEYDQGDEQDGYICEPAETINETEYMVTYPKFTTEYGTKISLKKGVWNGIAYDNDRLKLINLPVLKYHSGPGATASVKNYVGVLSKACHNHTCQTTGACRDFHDQLYGPESIVAREMVFGRMADLHLVDAIRIGTYTGPMVYYEEATRVDALVASTDPIALDYYATKNILYAISGNEDTNPDGNGVFNQYLVQAMNYLNSHGYTTTMSEGEMSVYVYDFQQPTVSPSASPSASPTPYPHCPPLGDADCNSKANALDFGYLLLHYGSSDPDADLNDSGEVDAADVLILLFNYAIYVT